MVSGKIKWSEWIFLKEDLSSSHSIEQGSFYVITFFIHEFFKSVIFFLRTNATFQCKEGKCMKLS